MNSQAALIAQKKKEIEEKLALQQKETDPKECEKDNVPAVEEIVIPAVPAVPFKNDGSFLEQFKQLQQQNLKTEIVAPSFEHLAQPDYPPPPPPIDVTVPPPMFLNRPPPEYQCNPPSVPVGFEEEVKRERAERSPSPYSPSRPCEDEDEQEHTFFKKGEWSTFAS